MIYFKTKSSTSMSSTLVPQNLKNPHNLGPQ